MKNLWSALLLFTTLAYSNNPPSTITDVTVYLNGAQITRTSSFKIPIGTSEFTFDKLSPYVDESSIQVSGLKNTSVLSINFSVDFLTKQEKSKDILALQNKIKEIHENIQMEDDQIAGYNEELNVIQANRLLGNDSEVVNLEKLKQFTEYYRTRITAIKKSINACAKKKNDFQQEISEIQKQLAESNVNDKEQTGKMKIKFNSDIPSQLDLVIRYNVTNTGWFPVYDLKATKINSPLELAYKAHIYQATGSDWNNVKLTLSTGDPTTNNLKPDMVPKHLNFVSSHAYRGNRPTKSYNYKYNPQVKTVAGIVTDQYGQPLPGVYIIEKGTVNGTQTDFDGKYALNTKNGNELVYSYIGMQSETLPIHSSVMNVSLDEDASQLSEVVVTGFGINRTSGKAGSSSNIVVRGISTIKGNPNALFIVDGIPVESYMAHQLDENDIESVQVLKDSEATSLYGSRGNNGVILVTTKNGQYTSKGDVIEQGMANTRFEIKKPYTIPTDGDITVVEIENYSVPATYAYFAAPVLNENVFLTAKIGNWERYNLLPGEADVYFEGSYSGKTNINPLETVDSLTISLGVDPNVIVKRTELKDFKKAQYIGSNRTVGKAYEIVLKNNKQTAVEVVLVDRIPISQNKEIKVEEIVTGGSAYNEEKGIMEWKAVLKPNDKKSFKFSYSVKYPKYKNINL